MAIKWFGESWGTPVNRDCQQIPIPLGWLCSYCEQPIQSEDSGLMIPELGSVTPGSNLYSRSEKPQHLDCFLWTLGIGEKDPGAYPPHEGRQG